MSIAALKPIGKTALVVLGVIVLYKIAKPYLPAFITSLMPF